MYHFGIRATNLGRYGKRDMTTGSIQRIVARGRTDMIGGHGIANSDDENGKHVG